mgnify:CR=1 FL=1
MPNRERKHRVPGSFPGRTMINLDSMIPSNATGRRPRRPGRVPCLVVAILLLWSYAGLGIHILFCHCPDHWGAQQGHCDASDDHCRERSPDESVARASISGRHSLLSKHTTACPVCLAFFKKFPEAARPNARSPFGFPLPGDDGVVESAAAVPLERLPRQHPPRAPPFRNS